jgi:hypothetical protein
MFIFSVQKRMEHDNGVWSMGVTVTMDGSIAAYDLRQCRCPSTETGVASEDYEIKAMQIQACVISNRSNECKLVERAFDG